MIYLFIIIVINMIQRSTNYFRNKCIRLYNIYCHDFDQLALWRRLRNSKIAPVPCSTTAGRGTLNLIINIA